MGKMIAVLKQAPKRTAKLNKVILKIEPEYKQLEITPSVEEQNFGGSYNKVTVKGDSDLIPENIKKDVELFGVMGTAELKGEENAVIDTTISTPSNTMRSGVSEYITKLPNTLKIEKTSCQSMFFGLLRLKVCPEIDTSNIITMDQMFYECSSLTSIPSLNTSRVTSMDNMFAKCTSLKEIPQLDTSKVTNMNAMFCECTNLITVPLLDTSKVTNMDHMFRKCTNLITVPLLEASTICRIFYMFYKCGLLKNMDGLKDLGKAYTQKTANYSNYKLDLSSCTNLTHESLMNVINNLYDLNLTYDVANGGTLYTQTLQLGSTLKAKLTAEEIVIATNKGWSVS